jgi:hypothetical protein
MRTATVLLSTLLFLAACGGETASASAQRQESPLPTFVWWEGEDPAETNFPESHWFAPQSETEAEKLSGGEWIGVDGERDETLFLEYQVVVPQAGEYFFFARKFWKHGPFRWRFNEQPWQQVTGEVALIDSVPFRENVVANWVSLGTVELSAGTHTFRLEATDNTSVMAYDAFLLIDAPYVPQGKLKPGEKVGGAPEGWFAFEPAPDPFAESPIDLRYLNEEYAGENGRIVRQGDDLVHEDTGERVVFWGVNIGPDGVRQDPALVDMNARFLAKKGVNAVRLHGAVWDESYQLDEEFRDRIFYSVAAYKEQGIYTTLSIFFPLWMSLEGDEPFAGYSGGQHPFAVPFFNPDFDAMYRAWWRDLLTVENPYTGLTLAEDPAVALVEMINEDSFFFWTFTPYDNVPAPQMAILERRFGDWLTAEYGSVQAALQAWGGEEVRGDDPASGRAGIVELWQMFNRKSPRDQDTARFLADTQRDWFTRTRDYLRDDLGYGGMISASNWITADPRVLGPIDKYTNTVGDVMDRHGYFGGVHQGPRASYSVNPGEVFADRSALRFDPAEPEEPNLVFANPIQDVVYADRPSIISEVNWPMPNRFRAEFPVLAAAYGSLQGSDGFFFFAHNTPGWQGALDKFPIATPAVMGQFPATALMVRTGMLQQGEPVVQANLNLDSLFRLEGAPVTAPQNLDALRAADIPAGQVASQGAIDPRAFFVGPVRMAFDETPADSRFADLSEFINPSAQVIRSNTGELVWDYGAGVLRVESPRAQGAVGFLGEYGPVELPDVTIELENEYGSVLVVSLDGEPLATSRRMLVQVMTEERNRGWQTTPSGMIQEIVDVGTFPLEVREPIGSVRLRIGSAFAMTPLDENGYPLPGSETSEVMLGDGVALYLLERD